ncbi:hypothetical protein HWV07_08930 [Natronomonas salina]|uniref:hypothetical protein n=1 Tax=Natronomonas salina TaxID=1710540 RepID=UPI0015B4BA96|nr:hypothetical protein [Natronomonas salina]QLD89148.1 hypothetical protein HWV07_08930 [Natronomonas salina]
MSQDSNSDAASKLSITLPPDWTNAETERLDENSYLVQRLDNSNHRPLLALPGGERPILVDVHYGRSVIVRNRIDAIRYGYQESDVYTEFYYLQIIDEPEWVQITEESPEHDLAIVPHLEEWVESGELTEAEAEWADDQFD